MPNVHPSAIVGPEVQLADDASIGPWCCLEGSITIGSGTRLLERVSVRGPARIGAGNTIYPGASLGFAPQDLKFDPDTPGSGIVLGDGNQVRESATIHRATGDRPTTLGNHSYMMVNSHLGHDSVVGDHVMLANNVGLGGHVEIGDRVILGGAAHVHQFCRIGRMAMMSGVTGTTQDIPPFCTVYVTRYIGSLNLVGLRRAGYRDSIKPLEQAFKLVFRSRLPNAEAVNQARRNDRMMADPLVSEFIEFIAASKRGISPYQSKRPFVRS